MFYSMPSFSFQDLKKKTLFLVKLAGGNDGINSLVHLNQYNLYKNLRPNISLRKTQLKLKISDKNNHYAFHPELSFLHDSYRRGELSTLLGIGIKNNDYSQTHSFQSHILNNVLNIHSENSNTNFHQELSRFIYSKKLEPLYHFSIKGFDTHKNSMSKHSSLMKKLNHHLSLLTYHLKRKNIFNNSLILTYSEFGRKSFENIKKGTDHGSSNIHFLLGGNLKIPRVLGEYPVLNKWDKNRNLDIHLDLKDVLAKVL